MRLQPCARHFLFPALCVSLVPLPLAVAMQVAIGTPGAVLEAFRWLALSLVFWWPLGFILCAWRGRELSRASVAYVVSLPLYVTTLVVIYPAAGAHFAPPDAPTWAIYLSATPWPFLGVYALYRLVRDGGRAARAIHRASYGVLSLSVALPFVWSLSVDHYRWPQGAPPSSPGTVVITHVRVVDVENRRVRSDVEVHIRAGRIVALALAGGSRPAGAVIDAQDGYLVPGLIDVHTHLQVPIERISAPFSYKYFVTQLLTQYADHRREYLRYGVTMVRDVGGPMAAGRHLRQALADHRLLGPRLLTVGRLVTSPRGHPVGTIWTRSIAGASAIEAEDGAAMERELEADLAGSPDAVKFIYGTIGRASTRLRADLLTEGVHWAAMHRLISVVHAETADEVRTAIDAGATGVEHVASMEALPPSLLTSIASKRPFVDATFGEYRAALALRGTPVKSIEQILSAKRDMIKALADAGARIVVGTDSPLIAYGAGVHNELDELRAAGFGEADLLKAATITNAEYLGRAHDAGRIAAGFLADLILTHENPLVDHRTLRTPTWVMLDGVLVVPPKR